MSLKHIQQRQTQTIFGKDLNVLIGDTFINGNLDIQGTINGTSSQGQNTDNTWTGTNEFSVNRPSCPVDSVGLQDGVNKTFLDEFITDSGICRQGATWTGTNIFNFPLTLNTSITPVNATDAVAGKYIQDSWNAENGSYLSSNNTWTANNTFSLLPQVIDPTTDTMIATKNYTDAQVANVASGDTLTTASQVNLANADLGATAIAVEVQIIGGGGGSTSSVGTCECSSAGVSGGSGSQASIIVLTNEIGMTSSYGLGYSISNGVGGSGGVGCGTNAGSGNGGSTTLTISPNIAKGLNPASYNLLRANGGGGFGGTCGQPGTAVGGTYSTLNPAVFAPFSSSNGTNGTQCAQSIPQYYGINTFGWGGRGAGCANGGLGYSGGYGLTSYLG